MQGDKKGNGNSEESSFKSEMTAIEPGKRLSKVVKVTLDSKSKASNTKSDPVSLKYEEMKLKCYKELESLRNELVANKQFKMPKNVYSNLVLAKFVPMIKLGFYMARNKH